ncbi:MAG: hypothetical protein HFI78_00570 [Lachnospiraceae bacterium]|jgi:hypothetical protein|nr:hypothetical protein [Lachnospiraceae bacterium]
MNMPAPKKMVKVSARQITNAASDELTLLWDEAIPTFMDEKVDGHLYERIANKQTAFYGHKYGFKVYVTDDHIHYREIEVEFIVRGIVVNKDKYTYAMERELYNVTDKEKIPISENEAYDLFRYVDSEEYVEYLYESNNLKDFW